MGWFGDLGRRKPWAQGCIVAASGLFLAISGCFGFLATLNFGGGRTSDARQVAGLVLAGVFVVGCLMLVTGFFWWLVKVVQGASRTRDTPPTPGA